MKCIEIHAPINGKQDSVLNHGEPVIDSVDERRMCFDVYNPNDDLNLESRAPFYLKTQQALHIQRLNYHCQTKRNGYDICWLI